MKELFYLHLPKTGGSSVVWHLERISKAYEEFNLVSLGHSWFKDTFYHGVRIGAGMHIKSEYDEFDTLTKSLGGNTPNGRWITLEEFTSNISFTIVRDFDSWVSSYYSSGKIGWHRNQTAQGLSRLNDPSKNWEKWCAKFADANNNDFPWYHQDWDSGHGPTGRFPANEWTKSNIWQLYDNEDNLMVDYVINFANLEEGLDAMFQHLKLQYVWNLPCLNQNPFVATDKWPTPKWDPKFKLKSYKDSSEFFTSSDQSLYIVGENQCI